MTDSGLRNPQNADARRASAFVIFKTNEVALLVALGAVVLFTVLMDRNHTYYYEAGRSLEMNCRRIAPLGIVALGATVVIIAGGIDLSAGAVIAFSSTICGVLMMMLAPQAFEADQSVGAGVLIVVVLSTIGVGLLVGTIHAWMITTLRLPPFVVTLGSLVGLRSLARALLFFMIKSEDRSFTQPFFKMLNKEVWIPMTVMLVLAVITWIILQRTVLGRHIYALGGNEQAARLSGIRTENVKWFAYCFSAMAASVAGLFFLPESGLKPGSVAAGYELNAIAAAVVGGCSLQGGIGTVPGTLLGAFFLRAVIDSVAKVIKASSDVYEGMIVGAIVVMAVTFSQLREIRTSGRRLFPGALGICAIVALVVLTSLVGVIILGRWTGWGVGIAMLVVLTAVYGWQASRADRH
jgi:ribose/xylose/arabinose/galactoside ABC-type transport system permease subunit